MDILADHTHDLVVRIEKAMGDNDQRMQYLWEVFGPDPRVCLASAGSALDEFPASPFHVTLPAGVVFARGLVHRLRAKLGDAVSATSILPDGNVVSITRAWALHRAHRAEASPTEFGDAQTIPAARLKLKLAKPGSNVDPEKSVGYPAKWDIMLDRIRDIRGPREAWLLLKWLVGLAWKRMANKQRMALWHFRHRTKTWRNR